MKASKFKLACVALIGFLSACSPTLDVTPDQAEQKINAALSPGDSSAKIEAYFKIEGLGATYNKFGKRYQSIIRHPDSDFHAITIHVYVDENKTFLKVEADDSYTFL